MTKIIISGGGTGGHVYPAIAIANALKMREAGAEILFVGAKGRMEMEKVPEAGYQIRGLWVSGLQRRISWRNLSFPFKVVTSVVMANRIIARFRPDLIIGVGGYASGPTLRMAAVRRIPSLIQEQNSYPGLTNKLIGKKVDKICVAYEGMEKFFPPDKIILTGNPVRQDILAPGDSPKALAYFHLNEAKKVVLVLGGSLGAGTINKSVVNCLKRKELMPDVQFLWQTGNYYHDMYRGNPTVNENKDVTVLPFIDRMDLAYTAADIIVCRGGAITISEVCIIGKPVILIPSPNVSEDHQTKNAAALVNKSAALMLKDGEAENGLCNLLKDLINNTELQKVLKENIIKLAIPDAADRIAEEALKLAARKK